MSAIGKNVFNIFLAVIVLFVAKHFLSDFGLKLYKMYYGVEGMTGNQKVPQKGTFISNEGRKWKNQTPFKVSENIYVFGGSDGGWFKMASVDSNGNFIENRYTNKCNSIDELTIDIWNSARRGGSYAVTDIILGPAAPATDYKMVTQGRGGGNLLTEPECKSYAGANKYGYGINNNNPIGCIKTGNEVRFSSGSKNYKCSSTNVCVEKPFVDGYTLVNSGKPSMNVSEEECKNLTNKLQGYTFSKISEQGNPNGCMLQNGLSPGAKGVYYNSAGTADCGAFDGVSQCIEKLASLQSAASLAAPAAQAPAPASAAKGTLSTADACKTYADAHPKYSWQSDDSWGDRPYGCVRYIPDGRIFFNKNTGTTAGTDYTANLWDIIVKDTGKDALPAVTSTPAPAAQAPAPASAATDEAKVADAATQVSQMHSDAQIATNEPAIVPGPAIGTWGGNNDSGVPDNSVASEAASSNLATQQIIPGAAYPSNTTVANVSGVYPTQDSLNNIQGGNAPQTMTGINTDMAPSPLAPTSSESVSKANDAISRNITGRNEEDAAIDISIKMKMSEHVAKNLVGNIPQYTTPQQYASGRTTGLNNNSYNPSYESMPQDSLGATYDNRLGGDYPSYSYNTQNNAGTAYTDQYKPVNPGKNPKPYNSLMDLFR